MELMMIPSREDLEVFLNNPDNTRSIVNPDFGYYIKPDALYMGIYNDGVLIGVHEVRKFWHSVVELHTIYAPEFRGKKPLQATRCLQHGC